MSLFDKIFPQRKEREAFRDYQTFFKTFTAYAPTFYSFGGAIYESELVRSAIDAKARNISKLKIEFFGNAQIAKLRHKPNDFQTWTQFMYRLATILEIHNTAFIVPIYDRFGNVEGVYPLLPTNVQIIERNGTPYLLYSFLTGGQAAIELSKCAVLTKHQYRSDFFGESNCALLPTMDLIHVDNQGIQEAVKNSATFRFMATLGNWSTDEDLTEERNTFTRLNMKREDEAGGILLFPNTWKDIKQIDSKPFTVDPEERKLIQTNVYNYFGVNEDVIQNKAFGDAWSAFYEGCIEPFAIQFSESMTSMLYTKREIAQGSIVMATANRLQYMSNKEKLEVSAQMADRGILNRDEVREIWNLPPLPNGEGQEYIIRGEYYNATDKINETEDENAD